MEAIIENAINTVHENAYNNVKNLLLGDSSQNLKSSINEMFLAWVESEHATEIESRQRMSCHYKNLVAFMSNLKEFDIE